MSTTPTDGQFGGNDGTVVKFYEDGSLGEGEIALHARTVDPLECVDVILERADVIALRDWLNTRFPKVEQ